jgi:hypothetical protein
MAPATAVGETALGASVVLRDGLRVGAALGVMVGTAEDVARRAEDRATCSAGPTDGTSAAASVGFAVVVSCDDALETVAAEGLN